MVDNNMLGALEPQKVKVNAASFAAKYRSKKECYYFMTVNVKGYLPGYETVTIYFLKGKSKQLRNYVCADLISGKKKHIKCNAVQHIYCPQYEGLSVEKMMEKAVQCPELIPYLPDSKEIAALPRQYLANVIYTIYG